MVSLKKREGMAEFWFSDDNIGLKVGEGPIISQLNARMGGLPWWFLYPCSWYPGFLDYRRFLRH